MHFERKILRRQGLAERSISPDSSYWGIKLGRILRKGVKKLLTVRVGRKEVRFAYLIVAAVASSWSSILLLVKTRSWPNKHLSINEGDASTFRSVKLIRHPDLFISFILQDHSSGKPENRSYAILTTYFINLRALHLKKQNIFAYTNLSTPTLLRTNLE